MPPRPDSERTPQESDREGAPAEAAYVDRVRAAAQRLGQQVDDETDPRSALAAVEGLSNIDVDVPTESAVPGGRLAKDTVRTAIRWYLLHLSSQMTAFAHAVAHLEGIIVQRTGQLEQDVVSLRRRIEQLEERLDRVEKGGPGQA
jgi:hypothetical protein